MFKHILVPIDGSPTSMLAVSKAAELAKAFGSLVTALYVIDPYPFTGVGTDFAYGQDQYLAAATAEAHDAIRVAREAIEASGGEVDPPVGEAHAVGRTQLAGRGRPLEQRHLERQRHDRAALQQQQLGVVEAHRLVAREAGLAVDDRQAHGFPRAGRCCKACAIRAQAGPVSSSRSPNFLSR